jgi:polyhydroxyalkanoate synthase
VGLNRRDLRDATAHWLRALARQPAPVLKVAASTARELALVAAGRSKVAPAPGDRRFADPAFTEHPAFRRLMQAYLATSNAAKDLVDRADLDPLRKRQAAFTVELMADAVAPTNVLLGNPGAIKHAYETAGMSLLRGTAHWVDDLRHNGGMPSQVDKRQFTVGENLATTPGAVVHRDEVFELIQYAPSRPQVHQRGVLIIPPQVNKFYFTDLAPGRSFSEHAVGSGQQVFTISWRNPTAAQRDWGLGTYVEACLRAIDIVRAITRQPDCNVVGFCAGGITLAALLGHLAALGQKSVHSATFSVTVLDLEAPSMLGMFVSHKAVTGAVTASRRKGVLDGEELSRVFAWMRPNDLVWNYWVNNYLLGNDPPTFDILFWNNDSTRLPAAFHADMLDVLTTNSLVSPGRLEILGTPIDLSRPSLDTYVVGGVTDHITPWKGCYQTTQVLGRRSTFVLSSAGHIQSLVNPPGNPKARFFAGGPLDGSADAWLKGATEVHGTWWDHWLTWITDRSGELRHAPKELGSAAHPPLMAAPGRYVHQR